MKHIAVIRALLGQSPALRDLYLIVRLRHLGYRSSICLFEYAFHQEIGTKLIRRIEIQSLAMSERLCITSDEPLRDSKELSEPGKKVSCPQRSGSHVRHASAGRRRNGTDHVHHQGDESKGGSIV